MNQIWIPQHALSRNEVYFDDTGANKEPVFMWCGILATQKYWIEFSKSWSSILAEPPSVPYWHQGEVRKRPGRAQPFCELSDCELQHKERRLAQLIGAASSSPPSSRVGIVVRIPRTYLHSFVTGKILLGQSKPVQFRKDVGISSLERAELIAFGSAAVLSALFSHKGAPLANLDMYYAGRKNDPYERASMEHHDAVLRNPHPALRQVRKLEFRDYRTGPIPLQAADMLAWHLGKRSRRSSPDDPMWNIIDGLQIYETRLGQHRLQQYVERWNDPALAAGLECTYTNWRIKRFYQRPRTKRR